MSTTGEHPDADETPTPVGDAERPPAPIQGQGSAEDAAEQQQAGLTEKGRVQRTRMSAWWIGLIVAAVLLIALLIFIGQNSQTVTIHYLGLEGEASLAVMLLLAAVAGLLLVAIPGTARIVQLRRALKKNNAHRKD